MTFEEYQKLAMATKTYPQTSNLWLMYPTLGLTGEAGEIANKIKKIFRDKNGNASSEFIEDMKSELGDVLWYIAAICDDLGIDMKEVADYNIKKLKDRKQRGVIKGNGDNR